MTSTLQDSASAPAPDALRYPTGRFQRPPSLDAAARAKAIETIAATPARRQGTRRGADRDTIPAWRMDRSSGGPSRAG